jgi:hypothetical protein
VFFGKQVYTKSICEKIFICKECDVICHNQYNYATYIDIISRLKRKYVLNKGITKEQYDKALQEHYKKRHFCGKVWCNACDDHVSIDNHQCYIGTLNEREKLKYQPTNKIIFYDYETYCHPETSEHIPNLVVAYRTNPEDINDYTEHIFSVYQPENESKSVNTRFCEWLFSNDNKEYTCIAHNSKGYDIHFIKQYLYNNEVQLQFSTIDTGRKSMSLKVNALNMRFMYHQTGWFINNN